MSEAEPAENRAQEQVSPELNAKFSTSDSSNFTQVFEKLKKEGDVQQQRKEPEFKRNSAPFPDQAMRFPGNDAQTSKALNQKSSESGFTQLLRRVSRESSNLKNTSTHVSAPNTVLRADSPSEFTRIITQSMLRETGNQEHNKNLSGAHDQPGTLISENRTPQAQPHLASPELMSSPRNIERLPSKQVNEHGSTRSLNPQPVLSGVQESSRILEGEGLLNSRVAEQAASTVSSRSPSIASRIVDSRVQEYVPLLLIANLFMTVLLLLLAGFALLHRK